MNIAVLMSTYNGQQYIKEQIESILAQEGDFKLYLWVRDDGSTDGTQQILQQYADRGQLQWYTGKNLRSAKSFLDLVSHCPGYEYYAFADQDDTWYPNKLSRGISAIEQMQCPAISCANARLVDARGEFLGRNVYQRIPHDDFYSVVCGGNIMGCTMTFNSKLAQILQRHPVPEAVTMHDAILLDICTLYGGRIVFDMEPYMDYRQHGSNVVGTQWKKTDAIKSRLDEIRQPQPISIAQQAKAILDVYEDAPQGEKREFLERVSHYRDSFWKALSLACSGKPKYNGLNMAVTKRLTILLRNR